MDDRDEYRLDLPALEDLLRARLDEPAPGRIQLVAGPRQVGKTTTMLALAEALGDRARYWAADGPEASLPGAWQRLWTDAEDVAARRGKAILLFDEIHLLGDWAARLKGEWDRLRRRRVPIHVVATGSSALHLATGSRETLAGRFERLTVSHWSAAALMRTFRLSANAATDLVVARGGYPGAMPYRRDARRWQAYVRDAIVEPAIGRDLLALAPVRRPALLRQVFALAAASPAQIVSLQKLQGQLQDRGALETIAGYLALLEDAFLVAAVPKHAARATRQRAAPPKLVTLSNALVASVDARAAPTPATDPMRFGAWVENACVAHAINAGQRVSYWRQEPLEVDAVLDGSWGRWVVEIKTGRVADPDLRAMLEFARREPAYRPLLVGDPAAATVASRVGVAFTDWRTFLIKGPPTR